VRIDFSASARPFPEDPETPRRLEKIGNASATTDDEGKATLSLSVPRVASYLVCQANIVGDNFRVREGDGDNPVPPGTTLVLDAVAVPTPDDVRQFRGLKDGDAVARLYKSGAYDKVILIPEPFDPHEQDPVKRIRRDEFWLEFKLAMRQFFREGYDVWLVEPPTTGQNVHEQAAQYAQAVQFAATMYRPGLSKGDVALFGYSMGGVVLRVATARWEADAGWRSALGLADEIPAGLAIFGDAPLRGAQINVPTQQFVWRKHKEGDVNLNSCSAQQMAREAGYVFSDGSTSRTTANHTAFFSNGADVRFPVPPFPRSCSDVGADRTDSQACICDAGPAVFSINGDGFAHGLRKIAFSNGTWADPNKCYGGARDLNAAGEDMCPEDPGGGGEFIPQPGNILFEVDTPVCPVGDETFRAEAPDLEGGSRNETVFNRRVRIDFPIPGVCQEARIRQFFSGTFIPIRSSLAADAPSSTPFDATFTNDFQGSHSNVYPSVFLPVMAELGKAFGGGTSEAPAAFMETHTTGGQGVLFDATKSRDPNGVVVQATWVFGDGATGPGLNADHTYAHAGTYGARLTVTDQDGLRDVVTSPVNVGNDPPHGDAAGPYTGTIDQPVQFDGSASRDFDGHIMNYSWDFGDGWLGEGAKPEHAYYAGGEHIVKLHVTDNAGVTTTAVTTATIGGNYAPTVQITHSGACGPTCSVTFTAAGSDANGDTLVYSWSGCTTATGPTAVCSSSAAGNLTAVVTAADGRGASAAASKTVTIYVAGYSTGPWSSCSGSGNYTCVSALANGCSRPGVQTRTVTPSAWTLVAEAAVSAPSSTQSCTQYSQGYINGYYTGDWGACSETCGGGLKYRTVYPNAWKSDSPNADAPPSSAMCNTQSCPLTCDSYGLYSSQGDCRGDGWPTCEIRYRDDQAGGTLTCWKGFN
jgi:hypothetical protein